MAKENSYSEKPRSDVIGVVKSPIVERGPKVAMAIRQPHSKISSGERKGAGELALDETGLVIDLSLPAGARRRNVSLIARITIARPVTALPTHDGYEKCRCPLRPVRYSVNYALNQHKQRKPRLPTCAF